MKSKLILWLVLALSGGLFGCSTTRQPLVIGRGSVEGTIQLPVRFSNYHELYVFIAKNEGIPESADTLFQLAADSETKIYALDESPSYVWVITPHFYNGGILDEIRGAQGNGGIYLVCPLAKNFTSGDTNHGFELVGIATGNACRFSSVNHVTRLITNWHISAAEQPETVYQWNGKCFEGIK